MFYKYAIIYTGTSVFGSSLSTPKKPTDPALQGCKAGTPRGVLDNMVGDEENNRLDHLKNHVVKGLVLC